MRRILFTSFLLCLLSTTILQAGVLGTSLLLQSKKNESLQKKIPALENKDILESIDDLSALRIEAVRTWIYYYATHGRSYLNLAISNSSYYRTIVEDIIYETDDMPMVISDLPILESAYNPYAVSHAGAVGLWQFMPATARGLNLSINKWEDGRRSLIDATHAALRHLSYLYKRHQSWEMALAAYNCGSSRVERAAALHPNLNYWELVETGDLPHETSLYVQKYAALSYLYRHNRFFNFKTSSPETVNLYSFTFQKPVSISHVAKKSGVPESILYLFNPQLKQNITPLQERGYSILIPQSYVENFKESEQSFYNLKIKRVKVHRISKGEYLSKIAKRYSVSIKELIRLNKLKKPYRLKPGECLYIPVL